MARTVEGIWCARSHRSTMLRRARVGSRVLPQTLVASAGRFVDMDKIIQYHAVMERLVARQEAVRTLSAGDAETGDALRGTAMFRSARSCLRSSPETSRRCKAPWPASLRPRSRQDR